jgi:hypothetical protein
MQLKIKQLKKGYGIKHKEYGYLQFEGLIKKNQFTDEPKVPHQYLFNQGVDENGNEQSDVIFINGEIFVEVQHLYEED